MIVKNFYKLIRTLFCNQGVSGSETKLTTIGGTDSTVLTYNLTISAVGAGSKPSTINAWTETAIGINENVRQMVYTIRMGSDNTETLFDDYNLKDTYSTDKISYLGISCVIPDSEECVKVFTMHFKNKSSEDIEIGEIGLFINTSGSLNTYATPVWAMLAREAYQEKVVVKPNEFCSITYALSMY